MQPLIVSSMMLSSFIGFMEDSDISSGGLVTRGSKLGDHFIHPSSKTNKDPPLVHDYSARFHQLFGL